MLLSVHKVPQGYPTAGYDVVEIQRLSQLAELITLGVWSPIIWAGNTRGEDNFTCADFCAFDFDEGPTIAQVERDLLDRRLSYVLGTTKSHGIAKGKKPACDRFRLVVPFNERIWDYDIFRYNMKKLTTAWGSDVVYDGARVWQTCRLIHNVQDDGESIHIDTDVPLEETRGYRKDRAEKWAKWRRDNKILPPATMQFLRGHVDQGNRNRALYFAAVSLLEYGHSCNRVRRLCSSVPGMKWLDGFETTLKSACKRAGADYE